MSILYVYIILCAGVVHILDLPWHNHNNNNSINNCNNNRKRRVSFLVRLRNASPMQISLPLLVPPRGAGAAMHCNVRTDFNAKQLQSLVHIYIYMCIQCM